MAVDLRKVKKLIELAEESSLLELEVSSADESVRIVRARLGATGGAATGATTIVTPQPQQGSRDGVAQDATTAPLVAVESPMAGTFYHASNPAAEPYVQVGTIVAVGDVLCIIESMKMMHEIRSATDGVVAQICVENAQPIGTGELLFKLK